MLPSVVRDEYKVLDRCNKLSSFCFFTSSISMDNSRTLERHCTDGVCHCDWRLTITNCEEATAMWYVNLINIILSGFVIILGTIFS